MAKITQEVHIYFKNGELTLYASFFYECSIPNLKKVVKFVDEVIPNPDKYIALLQEMDTILQTYYYFEELKPQKKKQIRSKLNFIHERIEDMLWRSCYEE